MSCRNCGFVPEPQPETTNSSDSLVSQILRGSRPLLDSDHAMLNAEISELEQLQSLYAAQLEEIPLCRCAVLKALENRKSIYAPIRRLPRDILIEIFHSVCDSWWQEADENTSLRRHSLDTSGPLWVLGRVCGLWRDTLHSSPASWARKLVVIGPFFKDATEILQTYLEHTGEHLLSLQVTCRKTAKDDEVLSLLVQSCQRWKNLRIRVTQLHMSHFVSISHFPALQTIDMYIYESHGRTVCHSDMLLSAPQLSRARLTGHQIKLPPGITHLSGTITCPEDLRLLSQLPNLRRCHLLLNQAMKEAPVVTVPQLTHLYIDVVDILNFLSAPLLSSLTIRRISPRLYSAQEPITCFLHRSRCHLESLSIREIFTSVTLSSVFALDACSTVSRLKLDLPPRMISSVAEALASPSVLPHLHHLIICISQYSYDAWTAILRMACSRRDAGMLKLVEVQFQEEAYEYLCEEDISALTGDDFAMRIEKWDPPRQEHLYLVR